MLRQAEKAYESLEYEQALKILIQVQQRKDLTPIQRARGFLYMGVAFTALGRAENAVQAFMEVLKVRPNFRLPPGVSPSIKAMFEQALKRLKLPAQPSPNGAATAGGAPAGGQTPGGGGASSGSKVSLAVRAPYHMDAGKSIPIKIDLDDPKNRVRQIVLRWRRRRGPDYSTIKVDYVPGAGKVDATIPGAAVGPDKGRIAYYVEARDATGNAVGHAGSDEQPREIELTAGESDKGGKSAWQWWAIGAGGAAVVAGGILAAVLLINGGNDLGDQALVSVIVE